MDALSRLPLDNIHLLGKGKVILHTEEETREVLERIHMDGHLGIRKTLRVFRRRFEGVRDKMLCQSVVSSGLGCQLGSDYWPRKVPQGQIEQAHSHGGAMGGGGLAPKNLIRPPKKVFYLEAKNAKIQA